MPEETPVPVDVEALLSAIRQGAPEGSFKKRLSQKALRGAIKNAKRRKERSEASILRQRRQQREKQR